MGCIGCFNNLAPGKVEGGLLRAARCSRHHRRGRRHFGILKDLRSHGSRLSFLEKGRAA